MSRLSGSCCTRTKDGKLFLVDNENNNVQVFDNNGTFLTAWGSTGFGKGAVLGPDRHRRRREREGLRQHEECVHREVYMPGPVVGAGAVRGEPAQPDREIGDR
jgi:hypothetical protein